MHLKAPEVSEVGGEVLLLLSPARFPAGILREHNNFSQEKSNRGGFGVNRRRDEVTSNRDTVKSCPVILCVDVARSGVQLLGQILI